MTEAAGDGFVKFCEEYGWPGEPKRTPSPPLTPATYTTLRAANEARQREWDVGGSIDLDYRANELAGEMGEACNVIKKLERERLGIRGSRANLNDLADELADVVICVDLIAMSVGVDVSIESSIAATYVSASQGGADLARQVGRLCDGVLYGPRRHFDMFCVGIVHAAFGIGALYGIDLTAAVVRKFNATSEKVGLKTRLV